MPDNAKSTHFLNARIGIGDDPVTGNQLRRNGADVFDGDRVSENITLIGGIGLIGNKLRNGFRPWESDKNCDLCIAHQSGPRGKPARANFVNIIYTGIQTGWNQSALRHRLNVIGRVLERCRQALQHGDSPDGGTNFEFPLKQSVGKSGIALLDSA